MMASTEGPKHVGVIGQFYFGKLNLLFNSDLQHSYCINSLHDLVNVN